MSQSPCRWGILGAANIARKNWKAIRNAGNSTLVAVASRDRARAAKFIEECQSAAPMPSPPVPCASYEEIIERRDIDALYIPLPTAIRKDWVMRAANAGKHVLCEKPCGVTSADVKAMLDACRKNGVQFMDGVMFMHSGRLALMQEMLADGKSVGAIQRINSQFSFRAPDGFMASNIRSSSELEPLGCLGDLGWYNIRFTLCALNEQMPERVSGRMLATHQRSDGGQPVPMAFSGELFFAGGVSAAYYCSFLTESQQWANVAGAKGYLHVKDFVVPFYGSETAFEVGNPVFQILGCDFNMEDHTRRFALPEYSNGAPSAQETNMIRHFARIVASGKLEPRWGEIALKTQQIVDACLQSAREDGKLVTI